MPSRSQLPSEYGRRPAVSDTPKTDAFREVIFAQYKEDELTGDGMGNILAALTNIETLERKREYECKCDVDWPEEYYELRQRLERERDEALAYADKLAAGLPEGMLPKDVEVLRDANLALAVERDSERAIADSLAEAAKAVIDQWETPNWRLRESTATYMNALRNTITAWKEARGE